MYWVFLVNTIPASIHQIYVSFVIIFKQETGKKNVVPGGNRAIPVRIGSGIVGHRDLGARRPVPDSKTLLLSKLSTLGPLENMCKGMFSFLTKTKEGHWEIWIRLFR